MEPFLAFYIRGAYWRHLANTTEPSVCGDDAALCQITFTTCFVCQQQCFGKQNFVVRVRVVIIKRWVVVYRVLVTYYG